MATSTEFEGTADSQYKLEFSADNGTTKHKVPILQESDYPEETPVLDDITPTDAHRTIKAKVDFVEDGTVKGQYIYKEGDAAAIALKTAYDNDTALTWYLTFEDAPGLNVEFDGFLAKHTPKPKKKEKIRVDFEISITSDLRALTVAP